MSNDNAESYTPSDLLLQTLKAMDSPTEPNTYKSDAEKFLEEARARREAARERLRGL